MQIQSVVNGMSIELANLKSADPVQAKQIQEQMQQQLQQLEANAAQQAATQQDKGNVIDVTA